MDLSTDSVVQFDLKEIMRRFEFLACHQDEKLNFLFPVKSFPHMEVLKIASKYFKGFDISNKNEFNLIEDLDYDILWGSCTFLGEDFLNLDKNIIYDIQSSHHEKLDSFALRINISNLLDGKVSQFGMEPEQIEKHINLKEVKNIHVHYSGVDLNLNHFKKLVEFVKSFATKLPNLEKINLGGGLGSLGEDEISEYISVIRRELKAKIYLEPGLFLSQDTGHLFTKVKNILEFDKHNIAILPINSQAHLKWSSTKLRLKLVSMNPTLDKKLQPGKKWIFCGATCSEQDRIVELNSVTKLIQINDIVMISGLNGYCYSWGTDFNGIPELQVVFINE